jgi:hypothetical protein
MQTSKLWLYFLLLVISLILNWFSFLFVLYIHA